MTKKTEKKFTELVEESELPQGYTEAAPKRVWWQKMEGAVIEGILLDVEERWGGKKDPNKAKQFIATVRIVNPHESIGVMGSDASEDKEEFPLNIGDEVSFDVSARLMALVELAQADIVYKVYIKARNKTKLANGNQMWNFSFGQMETNEKKAGAFPGK